MDRSLRRAVLERLAAVEEAALRAGSHLPVRVARTQLKTITDSWREVLLAHQPDLKGRCPVCSGWLRRRRWPCQVWVTAHRHLIGDAAGTAERTGQDTARMRRPRRVEVIPRQVEAPTAADQSAKLPPAERRAAEHQVAGDQVAEQYSDRPQPAPEIYRAAVTERRGALPRGQRGRNSRG